MAASCVFPTADETIQVGDRIIVIGSPRAARDWSEIIGPEDRRIREVVIFGAGLMGVAIAEPLLNQGIDVRLVEIDRDRAVAPPWKRCREPASTTPTAWTWTSPRARAGWSRTCGGLRDGRRRQELLRREARDAAWHRNVTIAIVIDPSSIGVFEHSDVDVAIDPRSLTAEEIVRFARDPRTRQW